MSHPLLYFGAAFTGFLLLFGSSSLSPFELFVLATGLLTGIFILRNHIFPIFQTGQNYMLIGLSAIVLLQLIYVENPNILFAAITLYLIGVYVLVQFWYRSNPQILTYGIYGYLTGALVSSVLGTYGYLIGVFSPLGTPLPFFWSDNVRLDVLFDDPVVYGAFLIPAILLLTYKIVTAESKQWILCTGFLLLVFGNLIMTGSRGAWLNFLVAGFLFLLLYRPFHTKKALVRIAGLSTLTLFFAVLLIFVIPLGGRTFYDATLEHRYGNSDLPRIENLQAAPRRLLERTRLELAFGSGSGSYEQITEQNYSAHNTYLRVLYEQGIVGIVLYLGLLFFVFKSLLQQRDSNQLLFALLFAILAGILVQNFFVDTLHWRHFWIALAFVL